MTSIETHEIGDTIVRVSGSGYPIVFVHGFTTTAEFWREQVEPFSKTNKVVRINLPGHGVSPRPTGRPYTMDAFVADVARVFKELNIEEAFLVGLSMGGTIAQNFALRFPQRVRALTLVGATPHGLGPDVNVDNVIKAIEANGVVKASQNVIDRSFGSAASQALLAFARQEVSQTPEFVAREAIASLNASDSRPRLKDLKMPTLVVVGDEDIITPPKESEALAAGIPNSVLAIVKKAGHFPMLEQPSDFNKLLADHLSRAKSHAVA